jgi:mannose-6-phosphate isomerase-like protein (cupin superfamily)
MSQRAAPYVLTPDHARSHQGTFPPIKAGAADTAGLLTVTEGVLPPGIPGPPLHIHYDTDECLYVVEGRLLIQIGEERHEIDAGSFAWLPRQIPHTYANTSTSPVRALGIAVPGGIEEFFAEQTAYFAQLQGPPDFAEIAAIGARYGGRLVGPPISSDAHAGTDDS